MSTPRARVWLFGPLPDLLLGCGLGYAALVLVLAASRVEMATLSGFLPFVVLVTGVPHYGATLLRVHAARRTRPDQARAALRLGALVWGAFAASLYSPRLGVGLITLYLSWSPWHYTGQNFGLLRMYLHRGGFAVSPALLRLCRGSFVLSFVLVLTSIHRAASAGGSDPLYAASEAYRFAPIGVPARVDAIVFIAAGLGFLGVTGAMVWQLARQGRPARLGPVLALVVSQAVWFVLPVSLGRLAPAVYGPTGVAALAFIWVAIAHSVQYLWISLYYARASGVVAGSRRATLRYLVVAVLAGAALWVVPAFLCAPGALGLLPFESGLALLVAAAVNLHHFLLDGMIWKLRDAPVRDVLLAAAPPPAGPGADRAGASAIGRAVLAVVGIAAVACWVVAAWEKEVGSRRAVAAGDLARLEVAARRLARVGRDGPRIHVALGQLHEARHELDAARGDYEAALALDPRSAAALDHLSGVWLARGDWRRALEASYRATLAAPARPALRRRYEELLARAAATEGGLVGDEIVVVAKPDEPGDEAAP